MLKPLLGTFSVSSTLTVLSIRIMRRLLASEVSPLPAI